VRGVIGGGRMVARPTPTGAEAMGAGKVDAAATAGLSAKAGPSTKAGSFAAFGPATTARPSDTIGACAKVAHGRADVWPEAPPPPRPATAPGPRQDHGHQPPRWPRPFV